jgi:hypothetical protein
MLTVSADMSLRHPATGCVTPFIKNLLPEQTASFRDRYPATGLPDAILGNEDIKI